MTVPEGGSGGGEQGSATLTLRKRITSSGVPRVIVRVAGVASSQGNYRVDILNRRGRVRRTRTFTSNLNGRKKLTFRVPLRLHRRKLTAELYQNDEYLSSTNP